MKNLFRYSFLFLLIFSFNFGYSQNNFPFPVNNAVWSVKNYFYPQFPFPQECITEYYGYLGDTIIDNLNYGKLYGNNLPQDYPFSDTAFNPSTATFVAAVREDSMQRVWIRMPTDTTDILYYDFSLNVGDTFCFDYFQWGCHTVSYIDSILVDSIYRKKINFNVMFSDFWIEGIGSFAGWFKWNLPGSWDYHVACLHLNNQIVYQYAPECHCDTYTFVNSLNIENKFIIYPNPPKDFLNIQFGHLVKEDFNVKIFDPSGKLLIEEKNSYKINTSHLSNGIYFLKIYLGNRGEYYKKIIKI